jgi:RHS repeat-associated protein
VDTVWIEDTLPGGASFQNNGSATSIHWDASQSASGTQSIVSGYVGNSNYGFFINGLSQPVAIGENVVFYARLNECAPPSELMIRWYNTASGYTVTYWGTPVLGGESGGINMGPMPAATGEWVRIEIPASQLRIEQSLVTKLDINYAGGQMWFDHFGKSGTACIPAPSVEPQIPSGEMVWIDDELPQGASLEGYVKWDATQHASGASSLAHTYAGAGLYGSSVVGLHHLATSGESALVYFRVNECAVPEEIKITWCAEGVTGNVYWGEPLLGGEGSTMGAVPTSSEWVRVVVPFSQLGIEGRTIDRISLEHHGGQVWFDRIGATGAPIAPAVLTGFTSSHASPQPSGTTITWTATATGSVMPLEYQFEREDLGVWSIVQPYGTSSSYTWTPTPADAGDHAVRVSVRNGGSASSFDDYDTLPLTITSDSGALVTPPVALLARRTNADQRQRRSFLAVLLDRTRTLFRGPEILPVSLGVTARPVVRESAGERHFLYTPELNLIVEATGAGGVDHEYIWFGGQPVAQIETSTGVLAWYFNDHLGTPILQTDGMATTVWRVEREPYGEMSAHREGAGRHQPLSFPGQEEDDGELSYNIHRWYRAGWGRYTQADPIGFTGGGPNLYVYVMDNPLKLTDSNGADMWVEGPSHSEPGGHLSINVGDPNCVYASYSFGVNGKGVLEGEVYRDQNLYGLFYKDYYRSLTPEEDQIALAALERTLGAKAQYGPWRTCRNYALENFTRLSHLGSPGKPLERIPGRDVGSSAVPWVSSTSATDAGNPVSSSTAASSSRARAAAPPAPQGTRAPVNCAIVRGQQVCVATGI